MTQSKLYEINDGKQVTRFMGRMIAAAGKPRPGARRWHEVRIYKTERHQYITHKIGRTLVAGENEFHTIKVCTRADGLRPALLTKDRDGIMYMTHVADAAFIEAMTNDAALRNCTQVMEVA